MKLRLIDAPRFPGAGPPTYQPGDCWYARSEEGVLACRRCGCPWRDNGDGTWSLYDTARLPGECCNNQGMDLEPAWFWWADHARTVSPAHLPYAEIAPEHAGKWPMIVVLPTGVTHCLHSPTYKDGKLGPSGWRVVGELPQVAVNPSINFGSPSSPRHWHGWVRNGEMVEA